MTLITNALLVENVFDFDFFLLINDKIKVKKDPLSFMFCLISVPDFHHLKTDDSTAGDQGGQQTTAEKEHKPPAAVNNNRHSSEVEDTFTDDEEDDEAIYCNVPS